MPATNDPILGIHAQALALRAQRMQVLASNLANADTPGYKARDLDFEEALSGAGGTPLALATPNPAHLGGTGVAAGTAEEKYRIPFQPSLDGNTVDAPMDQARFSENALAYQVSLTFVNNRFTTLLTAISGNT
ncbi:MAG: flagellar basal body rod protein FlgB [Steroidobacteraceae bacterium]